MNHIENSLLPKNFSLLLKLWHVKKDNNEKNWNMKGYIKKTRKIIGCKNDNPILIDGICFLVARMLLNNANYNPNDLIDLLNISFSSMNTVRVHYYTNDHSHYWKDFIDIEKTFFPENNIFFNE